MSYKVVRVAEICELMALFEGIFNFYMLFTQYTSVACGNCYCLFLTIQFERKLIEITHHNDEAGAATEISEKSPC